MATPATIPISIPERLQRAREAAARLAQLSTAQKNTILLAMADVIEANSAAILEANQVDLATCSLSGAMRDRLLRTPKRISAMAHGVRESAALADPVNKTLAEWTRPNGLRIR